MKVFLCKLLLLGCILATKSQQYSIPADTPLENVEDENIKAPSVNIEPPKYEPEATKTYESFLPPSATPQVPQRIYNEQGLLNYAQDFNSQNSFVPDYRPAIKTTLQPVLNLYLPENLKTNLNFPIEENKNFESQNLNLLPVPSQELQLPSLQSYNPNNDPKLYFKENLEKFDENTNQKIPTQLYPKKYNPKLDKKPSKVYLTNDRSDVFEVPKKDFKKKYSAVNLTPQTNQKLYEKYLKAENLKALRRQDYYVQEKQEAVPQNGFSVQQFEKNQRPSGAVDVAPTISYSKQNEELKAPKNHNKIYKPVAETPEASKLVETFQEQTPSFGDLKQGSSFSDEQVSSGTGFYGQIHHSAPAAKGERLQFQMQNHQGKDSYKFGFDTGKGHNRQFRYEERTKDGHVKGHYGYYDKEGKLRVVNYDADPHTGFHAEPASHH